MSLLDLTLCQLVYCVLPHTVSWHWFPLGGGVDWLCSMGVSHKSKSCGNRPQLLCAYVIVAVQEQGKHGRKHHMFWRWPHCTGTTLTLMVRWAWRSSCQSRIKCTIHSMSILFNQRPISLFFFFTCGAVRQWGCQFVSLLLLSDGPRMKGREWPAHACQENPEVVESR